MDSPDAVARNKALLIILSYLVGGGCGSLQALLLVSRRFYQAVSSDELWSSNEQAIGRYSSIFQGTGSEGSEAAEWSRYNEEAGLPLMNVVKLRWLAHHTSRLKILYGSLKHVSSAPSWSTSLLSCLSDPDLPTASPPSNGGKRIVIVGYGREIGPHSEERSMSLRVLQQLMYVIPSSATAGHQLRQCAPLVEGSEVVRTEPSPYGCRSQRVHQTNPGIRVEVHPHLAALKVRRVGDSRLAFAQFDYVTGQFQYKGEQYSALLIDLFRQSLGTILVVEYHPDEGGLVRLQEELSSLYALATRKLQKKSRGGVLNDMGVTQSDRAVGRLRDSSEPLLVLLALQQSVVFHGTQSAPSQPRRVVEALVREVGDMMRGIVSAEWGRGVVSCAVHSPRSWFVQPISANSDLGNLSEGYFAGINWLVRIGMKSRL